MTATAPVFNRKWAWVVTISQILGSVGFGLGMYKAMTTMTLMITYFQIDYTLYGSLVGVLGLCALITAIPGGLIMGKIGAANLCKLCLLLGCIGNVIPCAILLACGRATNFVVMTLWTIPGQLGWGAMSVGGTMLVSAWFPPKKRPLPMGCAGMFVPLSLAIVLFLSSPLIAMASTDGFTAEEIAACFGQSPAGIVTVTVAFTLYILVITIICMFTIKLPKSENSFLGINAANEEHSEGQQLEFDAGRNIDGFKCVGVWLVVIIFFCYSWGSMSFANYWPTYIESDPILGGFSVAPADANLMSQAVTFSMIAVSIIVGFALTKISRDYWWILILVVSIFICFNDVMLFNVPGAGWFVPLLIIYGCTQELWPCITYTLVPEMVDTPKALGAALGIVSFFMNITSTVANAVNGSLVDNQVMIPGGTWHALAVPLTILGIIALIMGIVLLFYWRRRWSILKARAAAMESGEAAAA